HVTAPSIMPPLAGLNMAATGTELIYECGSPPATPMGRIEPGPIPIEYFPNRDVAGAPVATHFAGRSLFVWMGSGPPAPGLRPDDWSARVTMSRLRADVAGPHTFELPAPGSTRLTLEGDAIPDA